MEEKLLISACLFGTDTMLFRQIRRIWELFSFMFQAFHTDSHERSGVILSNSRKICRQFLSKQGEECFKSFFDDILTSVRFFIVTGGKMRRK